MTQQSAGRRERKTAAEVFKKVLGISHDNYNNHGDGHLFIKAMEEYANQFQYEAVSDELSDDDIYKASRVYTHKQNFLPSQFMRTQASIDGFKAGANWMRERSHQSQQSVITEDQRQRLFDYFSNEHDLSLLDSDFNEIIEIMFPTKFPYGK